MSSLNLVLKVPKLGLLLAAVLVTGLLGACSNDERPAPAQAAGFPIPSHLDFRAPDPVVAWTDRLCRALLPVARGARTPPSLDANDPEGSRERFLTYLHNHVDVMRAALADIAAAGPAPVDKGPQADEVLVATLSKRRDELAAGFAELNAVPRNEHDTLMYTLTGITSLLVPTDDRTLLGLLPISLQPAIGHAPSCQALVASAGATGSPAPPTTIR